MGLLQMSEKETLYHRKQMFENMRVHGISAQIHSIGNVYEETYDFYNDIIDREKSFDEVIDTFITYEKSPSIQTLKSLGWYLDTEEFPIIAYIPVLYLKDNGRPATFKPAVDDKVTIVSNPVDGEDSDSEEFLIKEFVGSGFPNTIYYTVKIVPYRVADES